MSDVAIPMTGLGPRTDRLITNAVERMFQDDVKEMLVNRLVNPMTEYVHHTVKPYLIAAGIGYGVIIIMLGVIIYLLLRGKRL